MKRTPFDDEKTGEYNLWGKGYNMQKKTCLKIFIYQLEVNDMQLKLIQPQVYHMMVFKMLEYLRDKLFAAFLKYLKHLLDMMKIQKVKLH